MSQLKVYLNDTSGKRKLVTAELIEDRKRTCVVKLPDGKVITRKKVRDLPPQKGESNAVIQ